MDDELLDLVDGHDRVIGTINRKDYKQLLQNDDKFIRASNLFILNDDGKLWTPIRTAHKTIAPNGYDYGAGGHVASGDDYLETIIKEAGEEVNIEIKPEKIEFVAKTKSPTTRYFATLYLLRTNTTPIFNKSDFVSAEWLSPEELINAINQGHAAKSDLLNSVVMLQAYLADI